MNWNDDFLQSDLGKDELGAAWQCPGPPECREHDNLTLSPHEYCVGDKK